MEIVHIYSKQVRDFGKPVDLKISEVEVLVDQAPNPDQTQKYMPKYFIDMEASCEKDFSEHNTNTTSVVLKEIGIVHLEGAWPKDVDSTELEAKKRYIKKVEKDEKYPKAVKALTESVEEILKQNSALDIYQDYFTDLPSLSLQLDVPSARTVCVFKDPHHENFKRTVSYLSWQPTDGRKLAVAFCTLQFQKMTPDMPIDSYVWDINNPNVPEIALSPPSSPLCCLEFNPKETYTLVGGCYNGTIAVFDIRKGSEPVRYTELDISHKDPVYDVKWVQSKNMVQCMSCSTDGQAIVWDSRMLNEPLEVYTISAADAKESEFYSGVFGNNALEYDAGYSPTKFMVGTEQGNIVACTRKKNKTIQIDKIYYGHHGPIYSVQRNPGIGKYFLSVGDWTAKLYMEDLSFPIFSTKYMPTYLTDACWSATKSGTFFTTRMDGILDIWDITQKQSSPVFTYPVSDFSLSCVKVDFSRNVAIGDTNGCVHLVELSDALSVPIPNEKQIVTTILERETNREKNLDEAKKEMIIKKKAQQAKEANEKPPEVEMIENESELDG